MSDYTVRKINTKKCGNRLTPKMIDTIQKVFDNLQDVTCSINEVQDLDLSQIRELNNSFWSLYNTFHIEEQKQK
tara:strand:- start:1286 stop:1507 length:222 start_codon:yes stop_codon:yes gene_type:complete